MVGDKQTKQLEQPHERREVPDPTAQVEMLTLSPPSNVTLNKCLGFPMIELAEYDIYHMRWL